MSSKKSLAISYEQYLSEFKKTLTPSIKGEGNYIWIRHEKFSVVRFPDFNITKPSDSELKHVFRVFKCLLLNYTIVPNDKNLVNSVMYNCYSYNFENLSKNVKRDIKYGQRNLKFGFASWDEILTDGLKAFSDTRKRVGLSDGSAKIFRNRFNRFAQNDGHSAVAAWLDNNIIAFMSLVTVEDFVMIQGSFSTDDHKKYCPNNVLSDFVLNYFLNQNSFQVVCYGLSSIQEKTAKEGLNEYKIRIGFEAIPVQRIFLLHHIFTPFNGLLKRFLRMLLIILPKNRFIRKASGLSRYLA